MNVPFEGFDGPESDDNSFKDGSSATSLLEGRPCDSGAMESPRQSSNDERAAWINELKAMLRTFQCTDIGGDLDRSMLFIAVLDRYASGLDRDMCDDIMFSLAESGHSEAQESYAHILRAKGLAENAFSYYQRAAEQGDTYAEYNLGVCFYKGYGTEQNLELAIEYFKLAAIHGLSQASRIYGTLIQNSDPYEAALHLELAVDEGDLEAVCPYAELLETHFEDYGTAMNMRKDLEQYCSQKIEELAGETTEQLWYRRLRSSVWVSMGHSYLRQYQTAFEQWREADADKDLQSAVEYWRHAADEEDPQGLYQYGRMLNLGLGVSRDVDEAIRLFKKAAPLCPDAYLALAEIEFREKGPSKAFEFIKKKKQQGLLPATATPDWYVKEEDEELMRKAIRGFQTGGVA